MPGSKAGYGNTFSHKELLKNKRGCGHWCDRELTTCAYARVRSIARAVPWRMRNGSYDVTTIIRKF